jgi:hypothetical protein
MAIQHMKITSRSTPPGGAPFDMTLSIYDEVGTKRYDTEETFREAIFAFTKNVNPDGFTNTLKLLAESGSIITQAQLTDEGRKAFGIKDNE